DGLRNLLRQRDSRSPKAGEGVFRRGGRRPVQVKKTGALIVVRQVGEMGRGERLRVIGGAATPDQAGEGEEEGERQKGASRRSQAFEGRQRLIGFENHGSLLPC